MGSDCFEKDWLLAALLLLSPVGAMYPGSFVFAVAEYQLHPQDWIASSCI